jgi:hypothetical protein
MRSAGRRLPSHRGSRFRRHGDEQLRGGAAAVLRASHVVADGLSSALLTLRLWSPAWSSSSSARSCWTRQFEEKNKYMSIVTRFHHIL